MAAWSERRACARRTALVVEDYAPFRRLLFRLLSGDGWTVVEAASGREALRLGRSCAPSLVILDWCLGRGPDGLAVMRALRRSKTSGRAPVVVISAIRDEAGDEAAALAAGAALFLSKSEVVASTTAFLRHLEALTSHRPALLPLGGLRLDLSSGTLHGPDFTAALNNKEALLLEILARARGGLVSHERLWDEVWACSCPGWRHVLNNRMSALRRKARPLSARLVCKKGEGYFLKL